MLVAFNKLVVIDVVTLAVPVTSNVLAGAVVLIPTFSFVVNKLPKVLELKEALRVFKAKKDDVVILLESRLGIVAVVEIILSIDILGNVFAILFIYIF